MTDLQQVHLKIKEISKSNKHIPLDAILPEFSLSYDTLKNHLEALTHLEYLDADNYKKGEIRLTISGELGNLP